MRDRVTAELAALQNAPAEVFLNAAVDCHLRMSAVVQKAKKKCKLCTVHDDIELYEGIIFHFVKGEVRMFKGSVRQTITSEESKKLEEAGVYLHEEQRQGTWADSEAERLLRAILKFTRQRSSTLDYQVSFH